MRRQPLDGALLAHYEVPPTWQQRPQLVSFPENLGTKRIVLELSCVE